MRVLWKEKNTGFLLGRAAEEQRGWRPGSSKTGVKKGRWFSGSKKVVRFLVLTDLLYYFPSVGWEWGAQAD